MAQGPKTVRVMICDDNESVRLTLVRALRYRNGIDLIGHFGRVAQMLEELDRIQPDVIVLDANIPDMSGFDGIRELRRRGVCLPVIVMSADKRNEAPARALGAGFFYKGSADLDRLTQTIRSAAGSRRSARASSA